MIPPNQFSEIVFKGFSAVFGWFYRAGNVIPCLSNGNDIRIPVKFIASELIA